MNKPAITSQPIHPLLANRWSPCAFDPDKPISLESRASLLEAARWAPSCFGEQPWFFIICDKTTHTDEWAKALDCLLEGNRVWAKNAPLLMFSVANTLYAHNGKKNYHHAYDTGAAAISLVLEAEHQGLRAHQMGGFDPEKTRQTFNIPDHCVPLAAIAVGYQAESNALPEHLQERDEAPRKRKMLEENFFFGSWES